MGVLYLLHFSSPLHHARHYLGYTDERSAARRVAQHRAGRGGPLTRAARRSGIELYLAWRQEGERADERRLKRCSHVKRWCPLCQASAS